MVQSSPAPRRPYKTRTAEELDMFRRIVEEFDAKAMSDYFGQRYNELVHFAFKTCKNAETAPDFVQEAFATILKTQQKKKETGSGSFCEDYRLFDTWVHSVVHNSVRRQWDVGKRRIDMSTHFDTTAEISDSDGFGQSYLPDPEGVGAAGYVMPSSSAGFEDPLLYLLKLERHDQISNILSDFRSKAANDKGLRAALSFGDGKIYQEIADEEGIPLGTVRSRIHRGRETIKSVCEQVLEPV